jgi:uncharacterized protein with PIN domain
MKFLADHMLGTLARWLRFLGFDCAYPDTLSDKKLRELAQKEDRLLLTRDKELSKAKDVRTLYITGLDLEEQLLQVISQYDLKLTDAFSRCSLCNSNLTKLEKKYVKDKVPEKVYERQNEFWECKNCQKYYWKGTHFQNMVTTLKELEGKSSTL